MTISLFLFYLAGALTLGGALGVVMTRNIIYAAFALLATLMGVAGIFLLAFAEFLALVQVLIYGGAIVIVILFALMLTRIQPELPISSCLGPSNAPSSTRAIVVSVTDAVNHPIKLTKPSLGVVS